MKAKGVVPLDVPLAPRAPHIQMSPHLPLTVSSCDHLPDVRLCRQNNGPPAMSMSSTKSEYGTLHGKRDFADVIKLMTEVGRGGRAILDYRGGWAQCHHKGPIK